MPSAQKPLCLPLTWRAPATLDYDAMNRAAAILLRTSDFTSFSKLHTDAKTNICRVTRAEWIPTPGGRGMTFVITADRFLRNMVRAIVGTLVDVGRGKLSDIGFAEIIEARDRCAAGTSMPPRPSSSPASPTPTSPGNPPPRQSVMARNKNALLRYRTIDRCLRNTSRRWTLADLVDACSDALYEYEGSPTS